jgi:HAD superfamily hydrolase (TIGR01509 family)
MILGVIFDMDGVLVDSEPFIAAAMVRMFGEKGAMVHPDDLRPFIGTGEDNILKGVAAAHRIPLDLERDKARTYAIYLELVRGKLHPLAGVLEFVRTCRERGLKLAVASSADAVKVAGNLQEIGLPPSTFDVIVSGDQVARKKPSPDIFLEAAQRLGLDPSTCLVVEDAIAGVSAAKAAGARCLALTTSFTPSQLSEADWVAPTLAEAPGGVLEW